MSTVPTPPSGVQHGCSLFLGSRLLGIFAQAMMWYLVVVGILWAVGIEGIYYHPTPFYALYSPAFSSALLPLAVLAAVGLACVCFRALFFESGPQTGRAVTLQTVVGLTVAALIVAGLFREVSLSGRAAPEVLWRQWSQFRWHLLALVTFLAFLGLLLAWLPRLRWFEGEPPPFATGWTVAALVIFVFVFSGAVAMLRGGPDGIAQAYGRYQYEYIGDIGRGLTIRGLFSDYVAMHPSLSLHAKVHPPGPITLLWLLSYVVGRGALGLSLATMAVGSLGIVPLYLWARDLTDRRVALTGCLVYALMPSIVLFTATSADILFTPFSITTLFLFWRAIHRRSTAYALSAGAMYAVLSLFSFSLVSLGAFFGFVGLWRLRDRPQRLAVVRTAVVMLAAFAAVHFAVWWWSGFDIIACFKACKAQFDLDQAVLDSLEPRFPGWAWKIANPACWFFFAGIPVSVLFGWRLARPMWDTWCLFAVFALTLVALDLLYLGRGEGERAAMYIFPFAAVPAAHILDELGERARSYAPMAVTLAFMAFQCWLVESFLYTYW